MSKAVLQLMDQRVILFDGAMGTQLIDRGLQKGECPEMWNLNRPGDIREIHRAYFEAGADVVLTNTFGASAPKLAKFGIEDKIEEIIHAGVKLARDACPSHGFVAGDMGPTGLMLHPMGKATPDEIKNAYSQQARILADGGVDLLVIETQYDIREALAGLAGAMETGLPVFVTMTFEKKKRGFFTIMGNTVKDSMEQLQQEGASVVGANCSLSSGQFVQLTRELVECARVPVLVQPNAGQPQIDGDKVTYDEKPKQFVQNLSKSVEAGAGAIGACCGSTPEFTRQTAHWFELDIARK